MPNPFKNKARRQSYDEIVKMYRQRHKTLFTKDGDRNYGSSFAAHFWMGYDGETRGHANYSDRASRQTAGYVFYRAGQVIHVADGDTITAIKDGRKVRIRLYGIDSPESDQPFGSRAEKFTKNTIGNNRVEVVPKDKDRYGRTVALVYI